MKSRFFSLGVRFSPTALGLCLAAAILLPSGEAEAGVLVQYTFDADLTATTVASGISSASVFGGLVGGSTQFDPTRSGAVQAISVDGTTYGDPQQPFNNVSGTGGPEGTVFARMFTDSGIGDGFQHYFGFNFTITDGSTLNLESITFDLGYRQYAATAIKVEYSTTSDFSSGVVKVGEGSGYNSQTMLGYGGNETDGFTLGITQPTTTTNISWNRYTNAVNLGDNELLEGTIYVRIWAKGGTTGSSTTATRNLSADNITVNGTISPIPEPSAILLLMLGGLFACRRRRS